MCYHLNLTTCKGVVVTVGFCSRESIIGSNRSIRRRKTRHSDVNVVAFGDSMVDVKVIFTGPYYTAFVQGQGKLIIGTGNTRNSALHDFRDKIHYIKKHIDRTGNIPKNLTKDARRQYEFVKTLYSAEV